jgi:hypothetical protein
MVSFNREGHSNDVVRGSSNNPPNGKTVIIPNKYIFERIPRSRVGYVAPERVVYPTIYMFPHFKLPR